MKNSTRIASLALAALMALTLTSVTRAATNVIVPGANAATEGNDGNNYPFNLNASGLSSQRYQQVYGATAFSVLSGPHLITDILFRPDIDFGSAFSSTLANVQINLSTTSAAVDGLNTTFASNVGADDTIVHSGSLSLSSANTGAGPKDFDILIHLSTPFTYDPSLGNLLLDVRNFSGGLTTTFDSATSSADAISRIYTPQINGVNVTTPLAFDTSGLVTQFVFDGAVVPLPAAFPAGMALLGAIGLTKRLRRK